MSDERKKSTLPAAKAPVSPGTVTTLGVILSILIVVLGVIAIRDSLIAFKTITGTPWIPAVGNAIDGVKDQPWMIPAGVIAALIGLWFVLVSIKPRPKTGSALLGITGLSVETSTVSRIVEDAVGDVDGVLDVKAESAGSRIKIKAKTTGVNSEIEDNVRKRAEESLHGLATAPKISVKLKEGVGE